MLPERQGGGRANFLVAVRCRHLDAREEDAASLRYSRRGNARRHCVLLNRPAASSPAAAAAHSAGRGESQASVLLFDPDARGDPTALWGNCAASAQVPPPPPLLLQLDAEGLQRALAGQDGVRCFHFDEVFPPTATNEEIYTALVQRLVIAAENGYNGTVFAYGQTGTGKSHTVFGEKDEGVPGLCTLVAADLFGQRSRPACFPDICVPARVLYNEKLRDLLVDPATVTATNGGQSPIEGKRSRHPLSCRYDDLEVVEHPLHGVQVPHLKSFHVRCVEELQQLLDEGGRRRTKAATASNMTSSRSHAIVQFTVRRRIGDVVDAADTSCVRHVETDRREAQALRSFLTAKLWMVDLAGSERVSGFASLAATSSASGAGTDSVGGALLQRGSRRREGSNINRSLLALGNCIKALGTACRQQQRMNAAFGDAASYASHFRQQHAVLRGIKTTASCAAHVPYRDSKLTRLLKESLGGNTQTVMLATVSPSCSCFDETLSTLKYAARARSITRQVRQNVLVVATGSDEEEESAGTNEEAALAPAHGGERDCTSAAERQQANHRLLLMELEAEVRSLRTQLHVAEAATEKMMLPRPGGELTDVTPAASTAAPTASSDAGSGNHMEMGRCWEIYNQTRRDLQALLQERAMASAGPGNDTGGRRDLEKKGPIRALLRQERQSALLQERQRRIDAFLL